MFLYLQVHEDKHHPIRNFSFIFQNIWISQCSSSKILDWIHWYTGFIIINYSTISYHYDWMITQGWGNLQKLDGFNILLQKKTVLCVLLMSSFMLNELLNIDTWDNNAKSCTCINKQNVTKRAMAWKGHCTYWWKPQQITDMLEVIRCK